MKPERQMILSVPEQTRDNVCLVKSIYFSQPSPAPNSMLRTHTCGELRANTLAKPSHFAAGSIRLRDHKGVIFVDLRDRYGKTQVVFDPDAGKRTWKSRARCGRNLSLK